MTEEPKVIIPEVAEAGEGPRDSGDDTSLVVARDLLPESLLIVPLTDRPLFPKMMAPVLVAEPAVQKFVAESLQKKEPVYIGLVLVHTSEEEPSKAPTAADFHAMGVAGRLVQASKSQEGQPLQLLVQMLDRFEVVEMTAVEPVFRARVRYRFETGFEVNEELKAYSVAIVDTIKELVKLDPLFKEGLAMLMERINVNEPGTLADFAASMTTATGTELQEILETRSIRARIEKTLVLLKKEVEISKLKAQISKRIEERLSKQQREFFLKQQLKEIKQELGLAKDDTQTEVEKYQKRIQALTLSEEASDRIQEELDKLRLLEPSSPEFNVSRAYLDWLTVLPWGIHTEDNYDIDKAARVLDADHYGLAEVKERILELISVGIIKGDLAGSIILLVGPPGVGKTSVGQSIARSLGRRFYRFSLGGMRDEAEIKGHRRTYIGALPGKFLQAMKTCKTANPLIMLDEVDKIGASFRGDPASALLEVLDPEQNRDFLDHYLDVRFDLSKVLFICTANQLETIPGPLLDRMETIRLPGYTVEEKVEIARRHLLPKQQKLHGLKRGQVTLSKAVLRGIIDGYAREAGVRGLENNIKKLLRKAAKRIVGSKTRKVRIAKAELPDLLGKRFFSEEQVFKKPRVGVVMGLAYTSLGGATLYIEATPVHAERAGFKQTGQLGQVMVESSEIAYTHVRSLLKDDPAAAEFFSHSFIHLHVPAGATPKDGPSAGITMACALYSLAVDRPVLPALAMTGELTLSGLVMPIGGVKEKIMASQRAKVRQVILPHANREDFEHLEDHVRAGIEAHYVRSFKEVVRIAFGGARSRRSG